MEESLPSNQETAAWGIVLHPLPPGRMSTFSEQLSDTGVGSQAVDQSLFTWRSNQPRPLTGRNS